MDSSASHPALTPDDEDKGAARIAVVLGTRPEMVKLAPVINLLGTQADVIHTGQHYDPEMNERFGAPLGLGSYRARLRAGGMRRGTQLGEMVSELDQLFHDDPPHVVVVQGDTTSALAGALAGNSSCIPVLHVEAGLRSFDRRMAEEHNRVLIDHLADVCCAPTETNRSNLLAEGIAPERVVLTGNTVVEAVHANLPDTRTQRSLCTELGLRRSGYVVATVHRPENVDDPDILTLLLRELSRLPLPVVLPLHPRTHQRVRRYGLDPLLRSLLTIGPLGYQDMLALVSGAALVISDSGSLQEEASVLKRPIAVVRRSTERPEIQGTFGVLVDISQPGLREVLRTCLANAARQSAHLAKLPCPYGDGTASRRIADALQVLIAAPARSASVRTRAGTVGCQNETHISTVVV